MHRIRTLITTVVTAVGPAVGAQELRSSAPPPASVQAVTTGATAVRVSWTQSRLVRAYVVARFRQPNLTTAELTSSPVVGSAWDDAGLAAGQSYVYRVAAQYADGRIGVAEVSVTVPAPPARVGTPTRAPAPRLSPAPPPAWAPFRQVSRSIWPELRFELPPGAASIRIQRQQPGQAAPQLLTPDAIPVASLKTDGSAGGGMRVYTWRDQALQAPGTASYQVTVDLDDGRQGTSPWAPYTPDLREAHSITVTRTDAYTVRVEFFHVVDHEPRTFRLVRPGIPLAASPQATSATKMLPDGTYNIVWSVTVGSLSPGTYTWLLKAEYEPGVFSNGVPVSVTMP